MGPLSKITASRCLACQNARMARTYWIDLFAIETWKEFLDHGGDVSGFSEKRLATVERMKPGDYLLCYLTRVSRWVGVLEVTGEPLFDGAPIWSSRVSPAGFASGSSSRCAPSMGVPVLDIRGELTVFQDLDNPNRWQGPLRGSPARWKAADGEAVVRRCTRCRPTPVARPLGRLARIRHKPAVVPGSADGGVSVPEDDEPAGGEEPGSSGQRPCRDPVPAGEARGRDGLLMSTSPGTTRAECGRGSGWGICPAAG